MGEPAGGLVGEGEAVTPLELALLIVGAFMLFGVLGWIAVCLVKQRREGG